MNYRDKNKAFFSEHLRDRVQDEYDLTDEELDNLVSFLSDFDDPNTLLMRMSKPKNKEHLRKIVTQLLNEDRFDNSYKEMKLDPVTMQDTLTFPMGLPLSKDMIIEPHTLYEDH